MQTIVDNLTLVLTVCFVLCVAQGMLAQTMALEKGHGKRWFWAGCLLPLVGIVWVAGLPDVRLRAQVQELAQERHSLSALRTKSLRQDGDREKAAPEDATGGIAFDEALVAAVAASVAAMGKPGVQQTVRSVRRAAGPTAWSRSGDRRRA